MLKPTTMHLICERTFILIRLACIVFIAGGTDSYSQEPASNATNPANIAPVAQDGAPIGKCQWPQTVAVPIKSIEISVIEEDPAQKNYVYRSGSFEIIAEDRLDGGVIKEIALTFDATRALVKALPWGIDPKPSADIGHYQAKLYKTEASYYADGAPDPSSGFYSEEECIFCVPFQSLGLKMNNKTWFMKVNYKNEIIIHEMTHQLMHDYLPLLPEWIIEGMATYTEFLPYKEGCFQTAKHEEGLRSCVRQFKESGITFSDFRPIISHMQMSKEEWEKSASEGEHSTDQLYFQSYLLVYYFCHLDGDGKGTRFLKYLDAINAEKELCSRNETKRDSAMKVYKKALNEFLSLPGVKKLENGDFVYPSNLTLPQEPLDDYSKALDEFLSLPGVRMTGNYHLVYPSNLTPPQGKPLDESARLEDFGLKKLAILLDGRSSERLESEVKTAFQKLGVK